MNLGYEKIVSVNLFRLSLYKAASVDPEIKIFDSPYYSRDARSENVVVWVSVCVCVCVSVCVYVCVFVIVWAWFRVYVSESVFSRPIFNNYNL